MSWVGGLTVLHDKELAAVGIGSGIGHAQRAAEIVQLLAALILELSAVDALTARTGAGGVTAWIVKSLMTRWKMKAIIIALLARVTKFSTVFWGNLRVKLDV